MAEKYVYNLVFPEFCDEFIISGYKFKKVKDYDEQIIKLQNLFSFFPFLKINENSSEHVITSIVEIPDQEEEAIIYSRERNVTELADIQLILSIFNLRDIFVNDFGLMRNADPRQKMFGQLLLSSLPVKYRKVKTENGFYSYNAGFEEGINKIYSLIKTDNWRRTYNNGFFLKLFNSALRRDIIESCFIKCWTILEHIYALHNKELLENVKIKRVHSSEKISFILFHYGLLNKKVKIKEELKRLVDIRNSLTHNGSFPDYSYNNDALLIIHIAEYIVTKILGLSPTDVYNTISKLDNFLFK